MANVNKISLLKEIAYYTQLLEKHEKNKRENELKSSAAQQPCQNLNTKKYSVHNYSTNKSSSQPMAPFTQKYSFQKSNNPSSNTLNKRIVVCNQNFKAKSMISKSKFLKHASPVSKHKLENSISICDGKNLFSTSGDKPNKVFRKSSNESKKPVCVTKDFIKEIESLTELLKKKSSENQPSCLTSIAKSQHNHKQTNLSSVKKCDFNSSMKTKGQFSKTNSMTNTSINPYTLKLSVNTRKLNNCYTNTSGRHNKNYSIPLKPNKFSLKKVNVAQTINPNSKSNVKAVFNFKNELKESQVPQIKISDPNRVSDIQSKANGNIMSKSLPLEKRDSKLQMSKTSSAKKNTSAVMKVVSPILYKTKLSPTLLSTKVIKIKPNGTKYSKINNRLITPKSVHTKDVQSRLSSSKKIKKKIASKYRVINKSLTPTPCVTSKKIKKKITSKYRVINKSLTPCPNKNEKKFSRSFKCKENSLSFDSDPLLKDLNDPAIEKLEKNLLAMSTALTSTPVSGKDDLNSKKCEKSLVNSSLCLTKIPMKSSKSRISKYKFVKPEAIINLSLSKKRKMPSPKIVVKKVKRSKYSIINTHAQTKTVITPSKQKNSVLIRRVFKSKNVIINKNASPINYSAKMIKSKYLALNKRKFEACQKYGLYPGKPVHHLKFKGYSTIIKNRYKTGVLYHPRVTRKFTRGHQYSLRKEWRKNMYGKKYRTYNDGYSFAPVVHINGARYSVNPSRKTLRKLTIKDQTKRCGRAPDKSIKTLTSTPTTNLASRVLHRSINRILTASSKKSLSKINAYCMFYNRFGRCNRGVKCTYIHDPSKIAVCTRFLRGTCKVDKCPFSHEIDPGKMAICSYFLVGACEVDNCPYRHEKLSPNAVLCKAFVQGYCPDGKECKNAHILICPKYMQGECDKGSSCDFPHPPQKAKKNVQKDVEDEDKKQDDVLLDKVLRYFQQGGDSSEMPENKSIKNDNGDSCVPPRKRKLEEQPSFIPL